MFLIAENPGASKGFTPWTPTRQLPLDSSEGLHGPHTPGMLAGNTIQKSDTIQKRYYSYLKSQNLTRTLSYAITANAFVMQWT